jgi:hypothetical protein
MQQEKLAVGQVVRLRRAVWFYAPGVMRKVEAGETATIVNLKPSGSIWLGKDGMHAVAQVWELEPVAEADGAI